MSEPTNTPSPVEQVRAGNPLLAELTEDLLFGRIWADPALSPRDRSLVTVAVLVALYRGDQLKGHLRRALDNGVTPAEINALMVHVGFYAGWPTAMNGALIAREVLPPG